jgi:hypothetical protein
MRQTTLPGVDAPAPPPEPDEANKEMWALTYTRTLARSHLPNDPLLGTAYCGQAVRPVGIHYPTADAVANRRWKEEDGGAKHGDGSNLSFLEVLRIYGPEAFDNKIVWQTRGLNAEVQPLANDKEIALIAEHGGTVRTLTPSEPIKQTFNRQKGGQGQRNWYDGLHRALADKQWAIFQEEMRKYVAEFGTAYVRCDYVAKNRYKLGAHATGVRRRGTFIDGYPDRRAWLSELPRWSWNHRDAEDFHESMSASRASMWASFSSEKRSTVCEKISEGRKNRTAEEKVLTNEKKKLTMDKKTDEEKQASIEQAKITWSKRPDVVKKARKEKAMATMEAKTEAEKKAIIEKCSLTRFSDEKRLQELLHARKVAVPFESDKNQRVEIRRSGVHYMHYGDFIAHIETDGQLRRNVGLAKDPENIVASYESAVLPADRTKARLPKPERTKMTDEERRQGAAARKRAKVSLVTGKPSMIRTEIPLRMDAKNIRDRESRRRRKAARTEQDSAKKQAEARARLVAARRLAVPYERIPEKRKELYKSGERYMNYKGTIYNLTASGRLPQTVVGPAEDSDDEE